MSFIFMCPFCNQKLECDDALEGQITKCPKCGEDVVPTKENLSFRPMNNRFSPAPKGEIQRSQQADSRTTNKKKEYKVLTQKDKWFSGKFAPELLEQAINSYASQGWRVVAATTASFPALISGNREEMIIIMERDK